MPLHIKASDLDTILGIFASELPDIEIRAFGSRVAEEEPRPEADLDLALVAGHIISLERMIAIERAMAEAGLPFAVDVFDYSKLTKKFKDAIEKEHIVVKEKNV
ncbi:MAG: nucleotidyltransferase domain-containing protein [Fibromonadaceae bacterium]|nr:nucleotidyltransferase domain-containing protein [Fibromonadaceae bacterium]